MYYLNKIVGFAISPIGIAVFGGLLVLLCARLKLPRLAKCPPSHFGKTGLTYKLGILDGKPGYVFARGKWRYFSNIRRKILSA